MLKQLCGKKLIFLSSRKFQESIFYVENKRRKESAGGKQNAFSNCWLRIDVGLTCVFVLSPRKEKVGKLASQNSVINCLA